MGSRPSTGSSTSFSNVGDSVPVPLALDALPSLGGSLEYSSPTSVPMSDPCLDQFRRPSPIQSVQDVGPLAMHVPQLVKYKIWKGQYIDLSLLYRDNAVVALTSTDHGSALTMMVENVKVVFRPAASSHPRKLDTVDNGQAHSILSWLFLRRATLPDLPNCSSMRKLFGWLLRNFLVLGGVVTMSSFDYDKKPIHRARGLFWIWNFGLRSPRRSVCYPWLILVPPLVLGKNTQSKQSSCFSFNSTNGCRWNPCTVHVSMHIVAIAAHALDTGPRHVGLVQGLLIIISKLRPRTLVVHLHLRQRGPSPGFGRL